MKISLCIALWNMEPLLMRSIKTYCKQDFPKDDWELIIISDNSEGNVQPILDYAKDKINIKYERLEHNWGMRGNTVAFNRAFELSESDIIAETTAETMFPTDMVRKLHDLHIGKERRFVAAKTYNIPHNLQPIIDTVNWEEDVSNIMKLPGFLAEAIAMQNYHNTDFKTHQTCSIRKKTFYSLYPKGFPLFGDYGSEDPHYSGMREKHGVETFTLMQPMAFHQWHPIFGYWMVRGKAPMLNRNAHSMTNYLNDTSGHVPKGGTCEMWDKGSHEGIHQSDIEHYKTQDELVEKILGPKFWK